MVINWLISKLRYSTGCKNDRECSKWGPIQWKSATLQFLMMIFFWGEINFCFGFQIQTFPSTNAPIRIQITSKLYLFPILSFQPALIPLWHHIVVSFFWRRIFHLSVYFLLIAIWLTFNCLWFIQLKDLDAKSSHIYQFWAHPFHLYQKKVL